MSRIYDVDKKVRERTTKALVPVSLNACPSCGCPDLDRTQVGEMALLRHGGYGATRSTTTLSCPRCTWSLVVDVTETDPRKDAA